MQPRSPRTIRYCPHQSDCGENTPYPDDRSKHPVLPPNCCYSAFALGSVGEKTSLALEVLASNGQPDLRRLLHVAHPLAVHVCGADIELVVIQNKPDRDLVRIPGLAPIMGQGRGLLARYPREPRKRLRFHKLLLGYFNLNQQSA